MVDQPVQSTTPQPGSEDEFRQRLLTEVWATARHATEQVSAMIMTETASPAFMALADHKQRQAEFAARRFLEVGIEALYVSELVFATGIMSGALDPGRIVHAKQYASNFIVAAMRGQRCYCKGGKGETGDPCQWAGTMEDAGPAMLCPACGGRTLDLVMLDLGGGDLPGSSPRPGPRLVR